MLAKTTVVTNVGPDINLAQFRDILKKYNSPAQYEAEESYARVVARKVSPLFMLAIFNHESNMGLNGVTPMHNTHSPGNTRSSRLGYEGEVIVPDKGQYVVYEHWYEGFDDAAYRLVDPTFVYMEKAADTIGEIMPIWAPVSDNNDPDRYIRAVVEFMEKEGNGMKMPTQADIGFSVRPHRAADVGPVRSLTDVNMFIVHDTEGYFNWDEITLTSPADPVASTHFLIDRTGEVVVCLDLTETGWTPGNDDFARRSINVEMSGFAKNPYTDQQYIALANIYKWCVGQGCPIPPVYVGKKGTAGMLGHQDVPDPYNAGQWGGASHHTDPGSNFDWSRFVNLCKGGVVVVEPDVIFVPETKVSIGFGFKEYWRKVGLVGLGYPITDEFDIVFKSDVKKRTVQLFERGGLINEKENQPPWDNHPMTVGQLYEAFNYAASNRIIADSPFSSAWKDAVIVNLTKWGEAIDATLSTYAKDGLTVPELKTVYQMIVDMRSGKTYS